MGARSDAVGTPAKGNARGVHNNLAIMQQKSGNQIQTLVSIDKVTHTQKIEDRERRGLPRFSTVQYSVSTSTNESYQPSLVITNSVPDIDSHPPQHEQLGSFDFYQLGDEVRVPSLCALPNGRERGASQTTSNSNSSLDRMLSR